jgi:peptide/nickel transport system substrate-binding protein
MDSVSRRQETLALENERSRISRREVLGLAASVALSGNMPQSLAAAGPQGEVTWGIQTSLAPAWLDPAEAQGIVTPYTILYALHDAMLKPMPGQSLAPCLAESWSASKDGLSYEFVLRDGTMFHNGDLVTAEDVKFSFERYRGASRAALKSHVAEVEIPNPQRVRFTLKEPWPDFLTFYASVTGAGWVMPRKYLEKVGEDGFRKAPVGAGPYRCVSFQPGVELVFEAFEQYLRKTPNIKRVVLRGIPGEAARLAALKRGEVDIAYLIRGKLAEEVKNTPGLTLKPVVGQSTYWLDFPEQWDPNSPWHDQRVRLAASLAIDRETINQVQNLGYSRLTNSIIPDRFEFYWAPPAPKHDIARARQLLTQAGYSNGFDAGELCCADQWVGVGQAIINDLEAVGIRAKLHPIEPAAFYKAYANRELRGIVEVGVGAFGNAATRLEAFAVGGGTYSYGSYPDIDMMFQQQAGELDPTKREALLHRIQLLLYERATFAPLWQLAVLHGVGPRIKESGLELIEGFGLSAPYEDVTLTGV